MVTYLRNSFYTGSVQDQVTLLEHELLHGVGFTAQIDQNYMQNYQQIQQNCQQGQIELQAISPPDESLSP